MMMTNCQLDPNEDNLDKNNGLFFMMMHLKLGSAKRCPLCLGLNMLTSCHANFLRSFLLGNAIQSCDAC